MFIHNATTMLWYILLTILFTVIVDRYCVNVYNFDRVSIELSLLFHKRYGDNIKITENNPTVCYLRDEVTNLWVKGDDQQLKQYMRERISFVLLACKKKNMINKDLDTDYILSDSVMDSVCNFYAYYYKR